MSVQYPLDLTGVSPLSLVKDELHTVSESVMHDFAFIVPNFSPFYVDNFKAVVIVNGISRELVEDVDFSFALSYVTGTRTTGKVMYGGITLHNLNLNGLIQLTYQTVGGEQVADKLTVLTTLADKAYNPRTTIFDILTNAPIAFPPTPHYQDYDNLYGQEQLVNMLGEIRDAIITNSSLTQDEIKAFLLNLNSIQLEGFISKKGDTMEGPLLLVRDPIEDKEAATKVYIDTQYVSNAALVSILSTYMTEVDTTNALKSKLSLTGGTMTGPIVLNAPPQDNMHPVNKGYLDTEVYNLRQELNTLRGEMGMTDETLATKEEMMKLIGELSLRITHMGG